MPRNQRENSFSQRQINWWKDPPKKPIWSLCSKWNPQGRIQDFCLGGYFFGEGQKSLNIKNVKLIFNLSWFLGIFLVYAVIMRVKRDITLHNEQNSFRIGGGLPLCHPHFCLMVLETLEDAHFTSNWDLSSVQINQKWLDTNQPQVNAGKFTGKPFLTRLTLTEYKPYLKYRDNEL